MMNLFMNLFRKASFINFRGLWLLLMLVVVFSSCSSKKELKIGIDPCWYPQDFRENQIFVNGFVEELLLEISRDSGIEFYRLGANWDSLFDGLSQHRYEVVISSMPAYNFNAAKYDFSHNILNIGPVVVVQINSSAKNIHDLSNHVVGVLLGDQELLVMQKYPSIISRTYDSVPQIVAALVNSEIDAIVLDRLHAVNYVKGPSGKNLKIIGPPLNDLGLHFMTLKKDPSDAIKVFNKSLKHLKKNKRLQKLQKKWNLVD